ncbi:unnamed protein product, partial [Phaeothamnion confervicola]
SGSPASWHAAWARPTSLSRPTWWCAESVDGDELQGAQMALRWTAAGFLEAEKSFRKLRGYAQMKTLLNALRSNAQPLKKSA